jgi:small neutral amino acid transporter SnatA (MarC family)
MTPGILTYTIGTLAALFPIANPIGAVPIFYSLTATDTRSERRRTAQKTAINVVDSGVFWYFSQRIADCGRIIGRECRLGNGNKPTAID